MQKVEPSPTCKHNDLSGFFYFMLVNKDDPCRTADEKGSVAAARQACKNHHVNPVVNIS